MGTDLARAFDGRRPPSPELLSACVHCGFCLPTCPTYVLWGEEMDSPRGRIVLMAEGLREGSEMSPARVEHFDRCLGCMACVTACPSGVQYDRLIEATRPQVERRHRRSPRERALRRFLFATFPHPGRLRALAPLLAISQRIGVTRLARTGWFARAFPGLAALERLAPRARFRADPAAHLPAVVRPTGRPRGRVALLQGCVQRVFFGRVNVATAGVLAAEGFEVHSPELPVCCGALELHAGEEDAALERARAAIAVLEAYDAVVVNAAGCGSALKDARHLLADDPAWADRAAAFSARVRDVSEFMAEAGEPRSPRHPVPMVVAYHDACHLAHAQGVRTQPRELLRSIPGVRLVEPAEWEICCGSAGVYNVLQPDAGAELGRRKAANLIATGAEAVAAGNPGCALQISAFSEQAGRPLRVYHPVELLWMSIRGRRPAGR